MKTSRLSARRLIVLGCSCIALGSAFVFAHGRRDAGAANGAAADQEEYLTAIAPAGPPSSGPTAPDEIGKQPVEAVTQRVTVRLTGSLAADEKSDVGSNAAGLVSETRVDRGSLVKKGDLLIQLDPRDAENALNEGLAAGEELRVRLGLDESEEFRVDDVPEVEAARLALEQAKKNFDRSEQLKKANAIALSEAEQIETEYRSAVHRHRLAVRLAKQLYESCRTAMARLVTLRKALEDCSIRAPFDGWVVERNISVGERVIAMFPGAKLVTLLRIDPLRLSLTVPQQEMAQIKVGQTVTFQTDAFPGKTFSGTVRYITPAVATDNRSLCVEAIVPNPDALLRPGLFVTAELQLDKKRTELFVPQAAVCNRGDVAAVFVLRHGLIREQIVALGESAAGRVHVLSGLAPSDVVITTPEKVHDGDNVSQVAK